MHSLGTKTRKPPNALAFLRGFARPQSDHEQCELCSARLAEEHEHLIEPSARRLICSCTACAILFSHRGGSKYRRIPQRVQNLTNIQLSDLQWESFGLPISLAFLYHSTIAGRIVAVYPSPAGATESQLPLDAWEEFVSENPSLNDLEPDVEALLVNRIGSSRYHLRVGIDQCYRLAGILRMHWQGFSGGNKVWEEIDRFFKGLKLRSGSGEDSTNA
jgi:hypothetical protein